MSRDAIFNYTRDKINYLVMSRDAINIIIDIT